MVEWTAELEDFLSKSIDMSDREIANAITYITGEVVSESAIKIKRLRLGLLKRKGTGRRWGTSWNPKNVM